MDTHQLVTLLVASILFLTACGPAATPTPVPTPTPTPTPAGASVPAPPVQATRTPAPTSPPGKTSPTPVLAGPTPTMPGTPTPIPKAVPGSLPGRIVFSRDGQLYIMSADGSNMRRLTDGSTNCWAPALSPDGRLIAFVSIAKDNTHICVMNADGSNLRELTDSPFYARDEDPAWSPDGRLIAVASSPPLGRGGFTGRGSSKQICVMNADGSNPRCLTNDPVSFFHEPDWSHDGSLIAFYYSGSSFSDVVVMNADGSNERVLTENLKGRAGTTRSAISPAWSPNGKLIAFVFNGDIFVMNADGSDPHSLGSGGAQPTWSPDGRFIAFYSGFHKGIFVMNADGSDVRMITETPTGGGVYLDWGP